MKKDQLIHKKALESAEMEILAKAAVEIPAENWEEFELCMLAWLVPN